MSILQEFKQFALRGNVIDLAVAVVMGTAFNKIVASLVDGIIMPLIGLLIGGIDIANLSLTVGKAQIKWGSFLQNLIDFTLIAFSIFLIVKLVNLFQQQKEEQANTTSPEVTILTEIRDLLAKQSA